MATRAQQQKADEVEVLQEEPGTALNIDTGIVLATTISLIVAIVFVYMALGSQYGAGILG